MYFKYFYGSKIIKQSYIVENKHLLSIIALYTWNTLWKTENQQAAAQQFSELLCIK